MAQCGLSASQLGLAALISNAAATFTRLISGPVMDRAKKKNRVIIVLCVVSVSMILCFLGLPKEHDYLMEGRMDDSGFFVAQLHTEHNQPESQSNQSLNATEFTGERICWPVLATGCSTSSRSIYPFEQSEFDLKLVDVNETDYSAMYSIQAWQRHSQPEQNASTQFYCFYLSEERNRTDCIPIRNERIKPASYTTLILSIALRMVLFGAHAPIMNLLESITFSILGPRKSRFFGQTRLVGTLGYVLGALAIGPIISAFSVASFGERFVRFPSTNPDDHTVGVSYTPCILIAAGCATLAALSTFFIKQNSDRSKLELHKALLVAFQSSEMIKCMISCLVTGFATSLIGEYFTLILTTQYGLSHTFIGTLISVIVLTEVPTFFVSGFLVSRFGPALCVSAAHFVWAVYFVTIACISNQWGLLLVQAWSGLAFPIANNAILYQAAVVGRDKTLSQDGNLVASMQAITNAITFGLIPCFGGLIWGCLLEYFPGRYLYGMAACYSATVMLLVPFIDYVINKLDARRSS
ncbi:unnamed protein product [Echinostoma caproni]|uniref:MFS_1_like domain-containing protein n=1 Tax=Echinostoma caproni TaxID=27848 RepID=A0A183AHJ6_9TREM|nr:unnamed protein product [Echinostoma caproni]